MRESYSLPHNVNVQIQRPVCSKCSTRMMLARVAPARVGYDMRTFECPGCGHVYEIMVVNDAFGSPFAPTA